MSPIRLPKLPAFTSSLAKLRGRGRAQTSRSVQPLKYRNLVVDPLEERQLLSLNAVTYTDLLVNQTYSTSQGTIAGQSIASDHDGDFVVTWARQDTVTDGNGQTLQDWNIYARYFTDEVQRVTLPSGVLNNTIAPNGTMTLRYGGSTVVEKLTFSAGYQPSTPMGSQELINADFQLSFNGVEGGFVYNEAMGAVANAASLQAFLQGMAGNAAAHNLATAKVTAISAREFQVEFAADDSLVQAGSSQPLIKWTETVATTSGFLPSVAVDMVRQPYLLKNIPVVPGNAALTAANIEYAFKSYGKNTVSVVAVSETVFDITFTGSSAKQDHPQMVLAAVYDEFQNALVVPANAVKTLKESSPEFRVNAVETDDPNTMWSDFTDQTEPAVAMDSDGDFVITWTSEVLESTTADSVSDIYARRFSPAGWQASPAFVQGVTPLGSEFRVNTTTVGAQGQPAIGMNDDGTFIIAWAGTGQYFSYFNGISTQTFNRDGNRISNEMAVQIVDADATSIQSDPYVSLSENETVALTWTTTTHQTVDTVGIQQYGHGNLYVYNTAKELDYRTTLGDVPEETTSAFDDQDNLLISWTEHGIPALDSDQGGATSFGVRAIEYALYDAEGNAAVQVIRPLARVNAYGEGGTPPWAWNQVGSQAMIDADGDIVITYSGYGADTQEADVDQTIENLLYQRQNTLVANGISGQILEQQLAAYRLMLETQRSSYRGAANDVLYTHLDSGSSTTNGVLSTDTVINNTTDGHNARYYLAFSKLTTGGNLTLRVYRPTTDLTGGTAPFEDISIGVKTTDNVFDTEETRKAIRDALSAATFAGNQFPGDDNGPVDVRLVSNTEINARATTAWAIPGADAASQYVYEITFTGSLHDVDVEMFVQKNELEGAAVNEVQVLSMAPSGAIQTGYFRLLMNGVYTNDIYFDPNNLANVATAIQNALEAITDAQGVSPYMGVTVAVTSSSSPYQFTLTYAGQAANKDQPTPVFAASSDPTNLKTFQGSVSVATTTEGHAEQTAPPVVLDHYTYGDNGTNQNRASSGMTPEGDFVSAWSQAEEYTNGATSNTNIYFKLYNETNDTAGPMVTDFLLPSGSRLKNGGQVTTTLQYIVVSFDEQMMASGAYSVTNTANWALLRDGVEVLGGIQSIQFGMNKAYTLGLTSVGSNKWEAVILLDGNGASADTTANGTPLGDGHYQIVAKNTLRDKAGNPLRHTGYNVDGATYSRDFDVVVPTSGETRVNSNASGSQTTNPTSAQTVASDADGDYVTVWTTTGTGVFARLYDVDWQNSNDTRTSTSTPVKEVMVSQEATASFATVAMDADGDFVVTWSQQDPGNNWNVWARRYDATGTALGDAFRVNTYTTDIQRYSSVAMDTEGDFVITWQSQGQDGSGYGIYAQRYSPNGASVGGVDEIQVINFLNQFTGSFTLQLNGKTTSAITYSGNAFDIANTVQTQLNKLGVTVTVTASSYSALNITFTGTSGDTDQPQIYLASATPTSGSSGQIQIYTRVDGVSAEFRVNDTTVGNQRLPSIAMSADGSFVISWTSSGQNGDAAYETNVYAKRFFSNSVITGGSANLATVNTSLVTAAKDYVSQEYPYVVTTDDPGNHVVAPGTGYDGVVEVDLWYPDGQWMGGGSGSLLSTGMHILTAAHVACADGASALNASLITVTFNLPTGNVSYKVSQVIVNPNWTGDVSAGGDLAILVLEKPAPSTVERYDIYRGSDEVGRVFDLVGYGVAGTGATGANLDFGTKRSGQNRFDGTSGQLGDYPDGLLYDFDDGTKANDTLGAWLGVNNLGLGTSESCACHGDSGGPNFIDGKIAGVTSWGTSNISQFGTVAAAVRVSLYADWIDASLKSGAAEFLVNQTTTGNQMWSSVGMDSQGNFVVSWTSYNQDGIGDGPGGSSNGLNGVYARRFDSQGVAKSDEFLVNTFAAGNQQHSGVSMDADGDFVIVWESYQDRPINPSTTTTPDVPNSYGIYGQRYARTALLDKSSFLGPHGEIGSEIAINTTTEGDQRYPGVAMDANGDFVVVWSGNGTVSGQADSQGIFQTRFAKPNDDTGPIVTGVYNVVTSSNVDNRETVPEDALFDSDVASFVVTFSEDLNTVSGGINSVTNLNNWVLLKDGQTVYGGVAKVEELTSPGSDEYKGKHEFRIYFDSNSSTAGYQALGDGTYILTVRDRVQDLFKNALDGNNDGTAGGNFSRSFSVGVGLIPIPPGPDVPGPDDDDTPANTNTAGTQNGVVVASNAAGDYVLVWVDYGTLSDTATQGNIKAQRYDRFGQKQGNEFYVSSYTTGSQISPDVAMDDFGNFVVVWAGTGVGKDKTVIEQSGIFARVFDSFGVAQGDQFNVNDYRVDAQITPAVAMSSTGNFIVTWAGVGSGDTTGVYGHLFSALGTSKSADFRINTTTANTQNTPDVAADSAGNFTVVWASNAPTQDGSSWSVIGRRYSATGTALSSEFRVNNVTTSAQYDPAVAMDSDGDFVVAYTSMAQDGSNYGVYARRYNKAGTAQGNEVLVNKTTSGVQWQPAVAMDDTGKFVVTWSTFGQDNYDKLGPADTTPKDYGIYARLFNADGTAYLYDMNGDGTAEATSEFRVNATTAGNQVLPATSMDADGDLVIVWVGPDGSGDGVFERPIVLNPSTYLSGTGSSTTTSAIYTDPRIPTAVTTATLGLPTTLVLTGTTGNDTLEFVAGATPDAWVVKINGVITPIAANVVAITFDGLAGTDTVRLTGTEGADSVVVKPGAIGFTGSGFSLNASNVETFWVDAGNGSDVLTLTDSSSNDTLNVKPGTVTMTGGYSLTALGFETVTATAPNGGTDTANLYDTAGDDLLELTPTLGRLTGGGYSFSVASFETVIGNGSTGNDKALFTGSTGTDTFEASPTWARLLGTGFAIWSKGFATVQSAGGGGTDTAKFYGDAATNDTLTAWPQKATMTNADRGYNWSVSAFATITADGGTAGQDLANLYDSTGNDAFVASPLKASLKGTGYALTISEFEDINARSSGAGTDTATFSDSAGDDRFEALSSLARMYGSGYALRAWGFDTVTGIASTGRDVLVMDGTTGNDNFVLKKNSTVMTGGGLTKNAYYFDEVYLRGYGGSDTATIYDATVATSSQTQASLRAAAVTEWVQFSGIKTLQFRKTTDSSYKNDLLNLDQVLAYWP